MYVYVLCLQYCDVWFILHGPGLSSVRQQPRIRKHPPVRHTSVHGGWEGRCFIPD